ncbi:non-homologous end-joining DNA ligase [Aureibaculum luteum]|uniref:non-homologous end-joining DNA ligase n=1 Tax=Aureibaculum luteum TaxID=1548456 RepID=UPI000E4DD8A5|nr:non-homologous end-joining DNA ligase [Aureibaculum luteum]
MKTDTHNIKISHRDKILFPTSAITKNDIVIYYKNIANYMLPYLYNRPLTMQRFPEGITQTGFFQKNKPTCFPDWITTKKIKKVDGWVNHIICNTEKTLLYLVNQEVITFHIALSQIGKIDYPNKLVFDLDPPIGNFDLAIKAAKALRYLLKEQLELRTYIMTTGSRGLHVIIPLKSDENFDEVHEFSKMVATYISNKNSKEFTTAIRKDKRKGRLYIDYLRNSYAQTSVAPFSVRAIEHAPIATPINWDDLNDNSLHAQSYTISNIFKKLEKDGNPWADFNINCKSIGKSKIQMEKLIENI